MTIQVKCPTCSRTQAYSSGNPFRPFCSERCKTIDLGAWASEAYRIAGTENPMEGDEPGYLGGDSDPAPGTMPGRRR